MGAESFSSSLSLPVKIEDTLNPLWACELRIANHVSIYTSFLITPSLN